MACLKHALGLFESRTNMDIYCRKCGEPWASYGITCFVGEGSLTAREAQRFMKGEGCPSCHFGKHCIACHGTGKEGDHNSQPSCDECKNSRYLILRTLEGTNTWEYGYQPNIRQFTGEVQPIYDYGSHSCAAGRVREVSVLCPHCPDKALPCPACDGSGTLRELPANGMCQ